MYSAISAKRYGRILRCLTERCFWLPARRRMVRPSVDRLKTIIFSSGNQCDIAFWRFCFPSCRFYNKSSINSILINTHFIMQHEGDHTNRIKINNESSWKVNQLWKFNYLLILKNSVGGKGAVNHTTTPLQCLIVNCAQYTVYNNTLKRCSVADCPFSPHF